MFSSEQVEEMIKLLASRFRKTAFDNVETPIAHYIEATSSAEESKAIIEIFSAFKNGDEFLFKANPDITNGITIGYVDTRKILNDTEFDEVMDLISRVEPPVKIPQPQGFTPMEKIIEEGEELDEDGDVPASSAGSTIASGFGSNHKGR